MKVKTWKAWHDPVNVPTCCYHGKHRYYPSPVRIVPEATWRKVMAVVKAADTIRQTSYPVTISDWSAFDAAFDALREHERKRK